MPEPTPESVEALFEQVADLSPEQRGALSDPLRSAALRAVMNRAQQAIP